MTGFDGRGWPRIASREAPTSLNQCTTKVPTATDLTTGSFTLANADGRQGNGTPYKCRVINSEGISNTYASDIIKDMNNRYLNLLYTNSNYDITEWESEQTALKEIGISFEKQIELYEAI